MERDPSACTLDSSLDECPTFIIGGFLSISTLESTLETHFYLRLQHWVLSFHLRNQPLDIDFLCLTIQPWILTLISTLEIYLRNQPLDSNPLRNGFHFQPISNPNLRI